MPSAGRLGKGLFTVLGLVAAAASCSGGPARGAVGSMVRDFTVQPAAWSGAPPFTLSQHRDRPTLLYFMASWCVTCIPEAKALAVLQTEYGDRVNLIALDMDPNDSEDGLKSFKKVAKGADHLWALDRGSKLSKQLGVKNLDTTIIIAPDGRVTYRSIGPRGQATLKEALIAAGAPAS